jgi:hypothetical protein
MLMILRIDPRSDLRPERCRTLSLSQEVGVQNSRKTNFVFDTAILVEVIIEAVFVVCNSADHADDEATGADGMDTSSWTEIGVLPEETCVFFVNADGVLDVHRRTVMTDIGSRLFKKYGLLQAFYD